MYHHEYMAAIGNHDSETSRRAGADASGACGEGQTLPRVHPESRAGRAHALLADASRDRTRARDDGGRQSSTATKAEALTMGVKVRQRDGAWWVFVNHAKRRKAKRVGVGPSGKKAAQLAAVQIAAKLADGNMAVFDPPPPRPAAPTFAPVAERL